jgi:uncharacterized protein (DUF697 family)/tellurite resistance protein
MQPAEQTAILAIALLAAFADNEKDDAERAEVRRVAESLAAPDLNLAALYRDVLLKRVTLASAASALTSPELRQLAYELAVGVCDADGVRNAEETGFLERLAGELGLSSSESRSPLAAADALATTPMEPWEVPLPNAEVPAVKVPDAKTPDAKALDAQEQQVLSVDSTAALEKSILNYAILNGALELLPQSMASMAIIPLQMKMVHGIGKAHGYELDRGAIKDLLATLGVGLTGQYLEEIGRKVIGGLFGKAAGRLLGGLAGGATGVAFSFATTYALGHVALRYYAGGRTMSTQLLKESYASVLTRARGLQSEYRPQIEAQARNVDLAKLVQMARGR